MLNKWKLFQVDFDIWIIMVKKCIHTLATIVCGAVVARVLIMNIWLFGFGINIMVFGINQQKLSVHSIENIAGHFRSLRNDSFLILYD